MRLEWTEERPGVFMAIDGRVKWYVSHLPHTATAGRPWQVTRIANIGPGAHSGRVLGHHESADDGKAVCEEGRADVSDLGWGASLGGWTTAIGLGLKACHCGRGVARLYE